MINQDSRIKLLEQELSDVQKHLNGIEQYLRVNNIEIVGLPECNEDVILKTLNSLEHLSYAVVKEDIDISHQIPSQRKDGKGVSVCKFISRKIQQDILDEKKKFREFNYTGNDINEYLSPENCRIFGEVSNKRKQLKYKHLWTANGITYMRKDDCTPIITIDRVESLINLQ